MIEVRNLKKDFKGYHALQGIDLNVKKGEIYGFIGQNGAGKTTTMNILTGLSRPSSGSCIVNGRNVLGIRHPSELGIGYLPEEPRFYPWMTSFELLNYLGNVKSHRVTKDRINEILRWVGLEEAVSRRIGGFSRGMKQRIGIASALIHDPELLFLDEPSSALDPEGRSDVLELIKDLKGLGKTVFFSTHILDDVERVCDRVGMLAHGKIVLEKSLQDILNENISPVYDIELMKEYPDIIETVKKVTGVVSAEFVRDKISVTIKEKETVSIELMKLFIQKSIPVRTMELRKNSLEDIFIKEVNGK